MASGHGLCPHPDHIKTIALFYDKIKNKLLELSLYSVFLFLFLYSYYFYDAYQLPKSAGIFIILIFYFFTLILYQKLINSGIAGLLVFIFFIYIFLRMQFSLNNNPQFFYILTLFSPLLFFVSFNAEIKIKKILLFFNFLFFISCAYGLYQFLSGLNRPYSFFGNPIFFGEFLCMFIPLIMVSFYFFKHNKLFFLFNIMLGLLLIFLTSSRGVFLSLIISFCFLIYFLIQTGYLKYKKSFTTYILFVVIICILFLFIPGIKNSFNLNMERIANLHEIKDGPIKNRILMIKTALLIFRQNPVFGNGAGAIKYNYQKYQAEILQKNKGFEFLNTSYIHNDYMHLMTEFGIIGIFIFLILIFYFFYYFDKHSHKMDKKTYLFSIALLASLLGCLTESFINFPLFIMPSAAIFWIFSGLLYHQINRHNIQRENRFLYLITILTFILLFVFFVLNANKVISNFYLAKAMQKQSDLNYFDFAIKCDKKNYYAYFYAGYFLAKDGRYEQSLDYFFKALKIYPDSADLLFNIANVKRKQKEFDEAVEFYKKAIALYPDFSNAHLLLGKTYLDMGFEKQGIDEISKSKKNDEEFNENIFLFEETTDKNF